MTTSASSSSLSSAPNLLPNAALNRVLPEIWRRSLIAVFGLGVAFAAALFSTVTRESGNIVATSILAAGSILLSVWVGMTTLPYLTRRIVSGARWQDSFDFEVTRAGIVYVLTTLLIGVAALNTGNNLLYLIVSTMLGAVLVSGICSSAVLRGLALHVDLPQHLFANESAVGSVELRNNRKWLPSLSVSIVPPKERKQKERWQAESGNLGFAIMRSAQRQWVNIRDIKIRRVPEATLGPTVFRGTIHLALIAPRSSAKSAIPLCFPRRGVYRQDAFGLVTVFPFGLLVKRRNIEISRAIVVYPAVDATAELAQILPAIGSDLSSLHAGPGQDLLRIRSYETGDSARHVDWKATAKSGALRVREFARDEQVRLRIVFDNPAEGQVSDESYERGVRLAASLAWYFARVSQTVSFAAPGLPTSSDIWEFLRYLALVQPAVSSSILGDLKDTGEFNLIVTAQSVASLEPSLLSISRLCAW